MLVKCFCGYTADGIWFHTKARNQGKATYNCGVCIKGIGKGNEVGGDYYGVLYAVLCVEFTDEPI